MYVFRMLELLLVFGGLIFLILFLINFNRFTDAILAWFARRGK